MAPPGDAATDGPAGRTASWRGGASASVGDLDSLDLGRGLFAAVSGTAWAARHVAWEEGVLAVSGRTSGPTARHDGMGLCGALGADGLGGRTSRWAGTGEAAGEKVGPILTSRCIGDGEP
mmetsp:Transcript_57915/g.125911  ORF Transcript_57915/g.125911 Transcript_57915/m.125911 type:complete len:120 (+) Transcript_57915:562-921(+)